MYQYNKYPNNNRFWNNLILAAGMLIVVGIIVGAKKLFEFLFY